MTDAQIAERLSGLEFGTVLRWFGAQASDRDRQIAALLPTRDGEVENDVPVVSEGDDNGAYVLAWVWVDFSGTPLDKETEDGQ